MPVDIDKLRKFQEEESKRRAGGGKSQETQYFNMKEDGDYEIRILDVGTFRTATHWGILKAREGKKAGAPIRCPYFFDGSPCPVCEAVEVFSNSTSLEERQIAERWAAKGRYPMLVLDLRDENPAPKIFEATKTVFNEISRYLTSDLFRKWGDITSLKSGRNVTITKTSGKGNWYSVTVDPTISEVPLNPSDLPNLEEMLRPRSYEEIEFALQHKEFPQRGDSEERTPTRYDRGLPATKTRDEEPARVTTAATEMLEKSTIQDEDEEDSAGIQKKIQERLKAMKRGG